MSGVGSGLGCSLAEALVRLVVGWLGFDVYGWFGLGSFGVLGWAGVDSRVLAGWWLVCGGILLGFEAMAVAVLVDRGSLIVGWLGGGLLLVGHAGWDAAAGCCGGSWRCGVVAGGWLRIAQWMRASLWSSC